MRKSPGCALHRATCFFLLLLLPGWLQAALPSPVTRPGTRLRILAPDLLELELVQARAPDPAANPWNLADDALMAPAGERFAVTVGGRPGKVTAVGIKRRSVYAPLAQRDLRVATWIYLRLGDKVPDGADVQVANPDGKLWPAGSPFAARMEPGRESPAVHVNEEGYVPAFPKVAIVGYYLGTAGELEVPEDDSFRVVDANGATAFEGRLQRRAEGGVSFAAMPYQQVCAADFSALTKPGEYRVVVPGLGASLPFRIDEGIAMDFARAYALGIYEQRCGTDNALPFTRFTHDVCHRAPAEVPVPEVNHPFTWKELAKLAAEAPPGARGPALKGEAAQLYPFVRQGEIDTTGGHHDAGDYSKYTTNSASFVHVLIFAVDSLPGAAALDNLGLPESGDGISDLLQEAKWEADFLAKLQDDDGGFYFLVYPRDRAYEGNVLPDHGDPQVVWPKNTAATAAAVAALAQASSSPLFRKTYPEAARTYLEKARRGWRFLQEAEAKHGREGAYQRLTHYGDLFEDRDELAWAACELFLATAEDEYHAKFREWCNPADSAVRRWGWWRLSECWGHAIRSYAFAARSGRLPAKKLNAAQLAACEREIEAAGRDGLRWSGESAYGTSFPSETKKQRVAGWYFSLDRAFDLAVASQLDYPRADDPRPAFLAAYLANLNYEAGCNPVNQSYITGLGTRGQREFVDQYARNDARVLPPSGKPIGNLQAGQPWIDLYKKELGGMSFPSDGDATAPYPYYDRWTDTFNVGTEFVIVNQARALAGLAWLAGGTKAAGRPWRAGKGTIVGFPDKVPTGRPITVRFAAPPEIKEPPREIIWEARDQEPASGASFTFTPRRNGRQWVEAEARWTDGRRVFARAEVAADNGRPRVSVTAPVATGSVADNKDAVVVFHRTGELKAPLVVHFQLRGTATKWNDYHRIEGDMPVEITIPAGKDSAEMKLHPRASGLGASARHLVLLLAPDESYNVSSPHGVVVAFIGAGAKEIPVAPKLPGPPQEE